MRTSFAHFRWRLHGACLVPVLALAGCASLPPPTAELSAAQQAVARADAADAQQYAVDDLERAVEDNRRNRREAADAAESIIDLQVAQYARVQATGARSGPIRRLRAHGEAVKAEVLDRARQQLAAGQSPEATLEFLAHTLTNRLLHPPTAALRDAAASGDTAMLDAIARMLPSDDDAPDDRRDAADAAP